MNLKNEKKPLSSDVISDETITHQRESYMTSLKDQSLNFNRCNKVNFYGVDLTDDTGLFLYKEYGEKIELILLIQTIVSVPIRATEPMRAGGVPAEKKLYSESWRIVGDHYL
jgi:hypothetical protein